MLIRLKLKYRQWYTKKTVYKARTNQRKGHNGPVNYTKETWGNKKG